jgi:hypothetical protein
MQVTDAAEGLQYPLIVKHWNGGNSVGMGKDCKVADVKQLVAQVGCTLWVVGVVGGGGASTWECVNGYRHQPRPTLQPCLGMGMDWQQDTAGRKRLAQLQHTSQTPGYGLVCKVADVKQSRFCL